MNESITFVILVTIDTSDRIGATSVYGEHEFLQIVKEGAKVKGYKNVTTSFIDKPFTSSNIEFTTSVDIRS